jgi:hypothetical protein
MVLANDHCVYCILTCFGFCYNELCFTCFKCCYRECILMLTGSRLDDTTVNSQRIASNQFLSSINSRHTMGENCSIIVVRMMG